MTNIDRILGALANPTRREAMRLFSDGRECCLCELMERLGVGQSSMSRHMSALRTAGLVVDRRDAQWVRYRRDTTIAPAFAAVLDAVLSVAVDPATAI